MDQVISSNNDQPMAEILSRVEGEVRSVAMQIDDMQSSVSVPLAANPEMMKLFAGEMQSLDRIYQILAGLAHFMNVLSEQTPQNWQLDPTQALLALNLDELREGLQDDKGQKVDNGSKVEEFEMF